jgi:uncharacterized protein YeeX (DUF496 family)
MDLSELKKKFRHRSSVDIKDVEIAMKAVPFLVREIEKMEAKITDYEKRIDHLSGLLKKKRPPLEKTGQKNKMKWEARVNEEENRLYINLSGELDYSAVKLASNSIINVLPSLREGYDVINNFSELQGPFKKRVIFHLRKLVYNFSQTGVAHVVSVRISDIKPITDIFQLGAKTEGFQAFEVSTMEDAKSTLQNVGRFLKA